MEVPAILFLAPVAGLAMAFVLYRSERRLATLVLCPADGTTREVILSGNTFDHATWTDIRECAVPGEEPLRGRTLRCERRCLDTNSLPQMR